MSQTKNVLTTKLKTTQTLEGLLMRHTWLGLGAWLRAASRSGPGMRSRVCRGRELDLKWRQDCCEQEVDGHDNVPDRHLQQKGGASMWFSHVLGRQSQGRDARQRMSDRGGPCTV
eukprot:scaffold57967_cov63-Phaeocystis_antarctica.AAC.2